MGALRKSANRSGSKEVTESKRSSTQSTKKSKERVSSDVENEEEEEPKKDTGLDEVEEDADREGFGNGFEFILTCLGLAVGLGNIWRFPMRAYDNGGSAFLIPYLTCALLFGLPAVYMEFLAGQYQRVSPPIVFRRIMPILEGIGWMSCMVSACVGIYYIVIISWICIYFVNLCRGHMDVWNRCDNEWNDPTTCIETLAQKQCNSPTPPNWNMSLPIPDQMLFINGSCVDRKNYEHLKMLSGTEQYFERNILQISTGLLDLNRMNWPVFISMTVCWILTGLLILKGMKIMGKISYVTVILPYLIVLILFIRGITLDGASQGLYYYFGKPDFSLIFTTRTWTEALKQLCFSLSVGHGGLMSMASYSKKRNNCFKDALIIIIGDTTMSLVGGAAVFSTLGFLAHQRNVTVPEVVESGISLAFVVYPEAMSQMPVPFIWAGLFFLMLFLLGVSTEIAYVEVFCSCLYDQHKSLRKKKWMVVFAWCFVLYLSGLIFATDAGVYYFKMFDEYAAGFSSVSNVTIEIIAIMYFYGALNFRKDILAIMGPPKNVITKMIGPSSPFFILDWYIISPLIGVILIALSFIRDYPYEDNGAMFPPIFDYAGWLLSFFPLFMLPIFATKNIIYFLSNEYDVEGCIMLQKQHVSYNRIMADKTEDELNLRAILPDVEPWAEPKSESHYDTKSKNSASSKREEGAGNNEYQELDDGSSLISISYSSLSSTIDSPNVTHF